jgi:hypothetical protein
MFFVTISFSVTQNALAHTDIYPNPNPNTISILADPGVLSSGSVKITTCVAKVALTIEPLSLQSPSGIFTPIDHAPITIPPNSCHDFFIFPNTNEEGAYIARFTIDAGKLGKGSFAMPFVVIGQERDGGCRAWHFVNTATIDFMSKNIDFRRCGVIDNNPPVISRVFMTPNDVLCIEALDDNETVKVLVNNREVPKWSGSPAYFCTDERMPVLLRIKAYDRAGNSIHTDVLNINGKISLESTTITATVSEEMNPHHGVEGIVLNGSANQIRIAKSVEFGNELHLSEYALRKLDKQTLVKVSYMGQYENKAGFIYVFGANSGLIRTFKVDIGKDITLTEYKEKNVHGTLDLKTVNTTQLNAFQIYELERAYNEGELTNVQQNILDMVLSMQR